MKKLCPDCKKNMNEKISPAIDCKILHCYSCGSEYIYYIRTMELIKIQPRIKA